jgi:hypothetical protein
MEGVEEKGCICNVLCNSVACRDVSSFVNAYGFQGIHASSSLPEAIMRRTISLALLGCLDLEGSHIICNVICLF